MGTLNKSVQVAAKYEEFLAYDEQGNAVVLRRSSNGPTSETPATNQVTKTRSSVEQIVSEGKPKTNGSMGFFSGFEEVRARLQAKGLCASRAR